MRVDSKVILGPFQCAVLWTLVYNSTPPQTPGRSEIFYRPFLPLTIKHGKSDFPVGRALVDTGSDFTLLPIAIAHDLEVVLDDTEGLILDGAGGGVFTAFPSHKPLTFTIDHPGYRPISWKGIAYFAQEQPTILLGHHQCLEHFDLTFFGPEKRLSVMPRVLKK